MLQSYQFFCLTDESKKPIYEEAFKDLHNVDNVNFSKTDKPFTTVRRIFGDKFWSRTNVKKDYFVNVEDQGSFDMKELIDNVKTQNPIMVNGLIEWINDFIKLVAVKTSINPDNPIILYVTGEKLGLKSRTVTLDDIQELVSVDSEGQINGFKNEHKITELTKTAQESYKELSTTEGNEEKITELLAHYEKVREDSLVELFNGLFDLIKGSFALEDLSDVYNIAFVNSDEEIESVRIYQTSFRHDVDDFRTLI